MDQESHRIHPSAKKLWRLSGAIASIFILGISAVIMLLTVWWAVLPGALLSIYLIFLRPALEYRQWLYKITDQYVDYSHGIFFTRRTILPISRIQHLDIRQGPLQKAFKLASVVLFTAGQGHEIEAVPASEAQGIVDSINLQISKEAADERV